MRLSAMAAALALLQAFATPVCAEERFYALFFAYQTPDRKPTQAHSFVEYIRVESQPGGPTTILQRETISWLPASLVVRLGALRPEMGINLPLEETLQLGASKHVLAWGPYELTPNAWRLAMARKADLESGRWAYRAIDVIPGQSRYSTNCVHAAAEVDPDARRIGQYNVKYGEYATRQIVRHYVGQGFLPSPCEPHEEVWQLLGLEGRGIDRRNDWEPNALGRLLRPGLNCAARPARARPAR